jgi:hypothetical protein
MRQPGVVAATRRFALSAPSAHLSCSHSRSAPVPPSAPRCSPGPQREGESAPSCRPSGSTTHARCSSRGTLLGHLPPHLPGEARTSRNTAGVGGKDGRSNRLNRATQREGTGHGGTVAAVWGLEVRRSRLFVRSAGRFRPRPRSGNFQRVCPDWERVQRPRDQVHRRLIALGLRINPCHSLDRCRLLEQQKSSCAGIF